MIFFHQNESGARSPHSKTAMKKLTLLDVTLLIVLAVLVMMFLPHIFDQSHINSARATAMRNRGRGIWMVIVDANAERVSLGQPVLFPGDLAEAGTTFANAEDYFTYLMSDGVDTRVVAKEPKHRIVQDLKPQMLIGPGVPMDTNNVSVLPPNNAWHVVGVATDTPPELPFLVTRNAKASEIKRPITERAEQDLVPLAQNIKPFGNDRAVWVTRGGSTFDARRRQFTHARLFPVPNPELPVLPAQGGFQ